MVPTNIPADNKIIDEKQNFAIDTVEPFVEHLKQNGYPNAKATIDDAKLLAGGRSRSTLKLSTNVGEFVVQVQHLQQPMKLEQTVALQKHLHAKGIPTPKHVGNIGQYDDKHQFEMTHFVENTPLDDLSTKQIKAVARTLAKLHSAGKDFVANIENNEREVSLQTKVLNTVEKTINTATRIISRLKTASKNLLDQPDLLEPYTVKAISMVTRSSKDLEMSMTHNDIHKNNVLFNKHDHLVALIDFESARFAPIVHDIRAAARNIGCHHSPDSEATFQNFDLKSFKTFLETYNESRKIPDNELKDIQLSLKIEQAIIGIKEGISPEKRDQNNTDIAEVLSHIKLENMRAANRNSDIIRER